MGRMEINPTVWKYAEMKHPQGLQRMIAFIELFAYVKRIGF